ncbi:aminoglycoside phosphotransferase family protein [Ilumatobacter nonamiensis]|uniref:aminoglycoside phosphotransferase family protein n=1 Tax=Ilumatobacter nonamiensis TaxID=467093 RepID=UPI00034D6AAB|nr:aminoglycoside phosphotransferase family protein [Ilumatobacter nonamiensis]
MLSRGNTSDVYAIGVDAVVKVPRPEVPDHWVHMEARHAVAVHAAGLPAPRVLDVMEVDGRAAIVFERVDGPSMLERLVAAPGEAPQLAREMASMQQEILACPAPPELMALGDRVVRKVATACRVEAGDRVVAGELLDRLPSGSAVCHGDLHPGNILLAEAGPVVIDWFDACAGPPIADVVRSSIIVRPLRSTGTSPPHLCGVRTDVLDEFHTTYLECMFGELDLDADVALAWEAVLALSRLAEPLGPEIDDLVSIWRSRADLSGAPTTALAEMLLAGGGSEQ